MELQLLVPIHSTIINLSLITNIGTLHPNFGTYHYYPRVEAMRLREAHEKEAPLGFVKVTKATVISAGQKGNTCSD